MGFGEEKDITEIKIRTLSEALKICDNSMRASSGFSLIFD